MADGSSPYPARDAASKAEGSPSASPLEAAVTSTAWDAWQKTPEPAVAAFFDVDNTIVRGASMYYLARGLFRRRFFTVRDLVHVFVTQLRFVAFGEGQLHLADIEARALQFAAGHSATEMREIGEEVFDELLADRIWPGTLALARMHLDAGQRVWLVTATPVEVADVIATRLGLTGAIGTVAEQHEGVYTGRLYGKVMHGAAKAEAVAALAAREGLDLERCSAYSDSINDIPLLELVGNPCAINPDGRLRKHARARGWRVRDFRRGRVAVRAGIPAAAGAGTLFGAVTALLAVKRWLRR